MSGSYTLERELGGGGMSRVFLADEVRLGRKVVVKVLSPELAAGISAERFEREIRMAASLQQANIVPVLVTGETAGLPYYTIPFVDGESLRRRMSESPPLSISDIVRILGDVARALQYAHDHGIVHRDIKPDNVLLSGGTAVVTDFGIAKAISAARGERMAGETAGDARQSVLTSLGMSIGTPAYMAPEQAAGDPNIDRRADLYALGCMAFELLAGTPPFHGRAPARILAAHMTETPPPIAGLRPDAPAVLSNLVQRCLAKDPDERPQSAAEVIAALDGVASGSGMPAPAPFRRALLIYALSVVGVAAVARAATVTIGLPSWVLPGAFVVMALGLPAVLFTGYVQTVARRARTSATNGQSTTHGTMATFALRASPHVSWKRATRGGIYALGAFVVLVVAVMAMRSFGIGPVGSLFAAGKLNQRDVVLVSDFNVSRADSSVASVVAEGVRANLAESRSITLFSPTKVAAALTRMQRPATSRVDLALARQLALREGVKAIVTGDVTGLGNGFVIALKLIAADSGTLLAAYQTTVDGPSTLVSGVDAVTRKLRGKIGESLKSVAASPPLERVTTGSYDALKAYTEGAHASDVEHNFLKAIPLLRRAVAIDTGFATAWRKLGTTLNNAYYPPSAADSAVTKAYHLRARLSENERYLTEGYYFDLGPGHDRQKAIAAYQSLMDRGDTAYAANNMASDYVTLRQYAKADSLYRMSMKTGPDNTVPIANDVTALLDARNRTALDTILDLERKRLHNSWTYPYHLAMEQFNDGQYDRAERILDSTHRASTLPDVRQFAMFISYEVVATRGRLTEAEQHYAQAAVEARAMGNPLPAIVDSIAMASFDAWFLNRPERAVSRIDAALAAHPLSALAERDRPYGVLARLYATAGNPQRARATLAQFAQIKDTAYYRSRHAEVHEALGDIALAEKKYDVAIAEFRQGDLGSDGFPGADSPIRVHFNLGRAFDLANRPDSAIAELESYLAGGWDQRPDDDMYALAGVHKRLGELYDARGDRERAISHLTAFIKLWSNADIELLPAVTGAKRRLAKLQAGGAG